MAHPPPDPDPEITRSKLKNQVSQRKDDEGRLITARFFTKTFMECPVGDIGSGEVPESPKTTIRLDEGLRADAERCAEERGIKLAEFVRQSIAHYVAWCASARERNDENPQR